ncbi:MAG: HAMP domain-containing protein [Gammaproteobacteria bacterium]|nr:HAMP domain-containing protein [Gammaproteobacteria bacterium]
MTGVSLHRLLTSLRFQVGAAFVLLIALFAGASLATLAAFQRQVDADAVVDIAARLELTASQMHMQAMNYDAHAPRDYPTYYRDVELFYRDLMAQVRLFDAVVDGFMSGDFSAVLERPAAWMQPAREPELDAAVAALETAWQTHRAGLMDALGASTEEPRLEWAAEYNLEHLAGVENAADALADQLRQWAAAEHARLRRLVMLMLGGAVVVALVLLVLLQAYGLRPLRRTLEGVRAAAAGDFAQQVPVRGATELRDLAGGFNALSARLDLLFQLLDRLQRGDDLDDLVGFLSRDFRGLLRFDWIGVVLVTPDNATVRLEASALDGAPEPGDKALFRFQGTLLEEALATDRPFHVRDMTATAAANPSYELLRDIARRGLADAIFLPVATETPVPAAVAFATREAGRYDAAHLAFLSNIAQLLSASFGRTVRLAERQRLAAIGEFASAIVHELRSPLATVSLALEHFARLDLSSTTHRRLTLAQSERDRMERLLEEILLYAKPLRLASEPVSLAPLAAATVEIMQGQKACAGRRIRLEPGKPGIQVLGDRDRLQQVLINLVANACDAAPADAAIRVSVDTVGERRAEIRIINPGTPPSADVLARAFEPFVSAKEGGTGLGLAIVQRLVALHGGEVQLDALSDGTQARVVLPLIRTAGAEDHASQRSADNLGPDVW